MRTPVLGDLPLFLAHGRSDASIFCGIHEPQESKPMRPRVVLHLKTSLQTQSRVDLSFGAAKHFELRLELRPEVSAVTEQNRGSYPSKQLRRGGEGAGDREVLRGF